LILIGCRIKLPVTGMSRKNANKKISQFYWGKR
jgi:hypothetical protein